MAYEHRSLCYRKNELSVIRYRENRFLQQWVRVGCCCCCCCKLQHSGLHRDSSSRYHSRLYYYYNTDVCFSRTQRLFFSLLSFIYIILYIIIYYCHFIYYRRPRIYFCVANTGQHKSHNILSCTNTVYIYIYT